jgi:exosortase/archaeosortase family protein
MMATKTSPLDSNENAVSKLDLFEQAENHHVPEPASNTRWFRLWTGMFCANAVCYAIVWVTSLGEDPIRQLLAGAFTVASAFVAWKRDVKKTKDFETIEADRANSDPVNSDPVNSAPADSVPADSSPTNSGQVNSGLANSSLFAVAALVICCLAIFVTGNLHTARAYLMANIGLSFSFVWTFFGWQRAKAIFPAVFLSLFTLPDLPEEFRAYLFIPLQHVCTAMAGEIAKLFVPLTYSGHFFTVDGHEMNVAPSCAGLGMWACFLFAFAIWQGFKRYKPAAYIAAFITDPILVMILNTVRLAVTAIVVHYHSLRLALEIHANMEAILVPLGLFILWKVGACFAEND